LIQIVLLTTCEAIVMVSGAVVVSSQTTSTRAANLLASFIIIPMALLVQAESVIMFWGMYDVLWGFVALLIVIDLLLIRMGVQLFDREQLLGREFDTLNLKHGWRTFVAFFKRIEPRGDVQRFSLWRIYRRDVPSILRRAGGASTTVLIATGIGLIAGYLFAQSQPYDVEMRSDALLLTPQFILGNNLRVVVVSVIIGIFTFGVIPTVVPLVNSALIAFVLIRAGASGLDPLTLLVAGILPHGVFEVTGVWLASILALRLGAAIIARPPRMTVSEGWLLALSDYFKVFVFVVAPLLALASLIEVYVTPQLLYAALGR
jgi:uncharacterized membrane protein SpoIIM required for sporulation